MLESVKTFSLKLWDEDNRRLITWRQLRQLGGTKAA
jgi:hypothetical protein